MKKRVSIKKCEVGGQPVGKAVGEYSKAGTSKTNTNVPADAGQVAKSKRMIGYKKGGSVGKTPTTPAQKKFAAIAPPKNKITFADKIAGSKKKK